MSTTNRKPMPTVEVTFRHDEILWLADSLRRPGVRSAMGLRMGAAGNTGQAPRRALSAIERAENAAKCDAARAENETMEVKP